MPLSRARMGRHSPNAGRQAAGAIRRLRSIGVARATRQVCQPLGYSAPDHSQHADALRHLGHQFEASVHGGQVDQRGPNRIGSVSQGGLGRLEAQLDGGHLRRLVVVVAHRGVLMLGVAHAHDSLSFSAARSSHSVTSVVRIGTHSTTSVEVSGADGM